MKPCNCLRHGPTRQRLVDGWVLSGDIGKIDENGYVYASNVTEIEELIEMMDASRAYQNNIEVISTAKQLMSRTLEVIKV